MAQLKDTTIDGSLEVSSNITLNYGKNLYGIHPTSGEIASLISMSENGNTIIGYTGYDEQNGNSHIYGNNIYHYVASAGNVSYRPYYRAGDVLNLTIYTTGFVTSSGTSIRFLVPFARPIIGNPTVTITSGSGLTLRQGGKYTHDSTSTTSVKPSSYETIGDTDWNSIQIVANMSTTTNVQNNDALGIYWNGTITFS